MGSSCSRHRPSGWASRQRAVVRSAESMSLHCLGWFDRGWAEEEEAATKGGKLIVAVLWLAAQNFSSSSCRSVFVLNERAWSASETWAC